MARFIFYDDKIVNILLKEEKPSGGAAVQAYGWIQGLLASTQDVYLLTTPNSENNFKEECLNIKILPDYEPSKGIRWVRWVYYRIPHIYKALRQVKPDYVYKGIPSWHSSILAIICHSLNIKFIQRVSNDFLIDDRFFTKYSRTHRLLQDIGFRLSSCILCQNEYQFRIIKRKFPRKTVYKISNPIVLNNSHTINDTKYDSYISWLGLFQYQKNLKLLYDIASKLGNHTFLIAGKEASQVDNETMEYLEKLKELPNVKFIGFLPRHEVLPFLSRSKFLLNTSHYEGFSNTFLEAMATGTPILTTEQVNPDSIISDHDLGIVYKDALHLSRQIEAIPRPVYEALSKKVTDYVNQNHDHRLLTNSLLDILKTV
ncbi:glycosyltransferase family 4 protein [uncultured Pontibacter sp.]|uniref:glycosyltransferase family 4 protein n=1 Tax=uncultured Pontibacter sp. TaxID=453356 RepID=UPI00260EE292|nr:glycosyltransferase family 4 protein [uncultured Pontibacter sp.]